MARRRRTSRSCRPPARTASPPPLALVVSPITATAAVMLVILRRDRRRRIAVDRIPADHGVDPRVIGRGEHADLAAERVPAVAIFVGVDGEHGLRERPRDLGADVVGEALMIGEEPGVGVVGDDRR